MKTTVKSLIMLGLLLLNNNLRAQTDTSSFSNMRLDQLMNVEITGVSRYSQSSNEAPNSVVVITQQQIFERGYRDLIDVLKDVPGFDIVENAGRFGEFYTFRGIQGNDRFLILVDGHKINPSSGTFISTGNSLSVKMAKQIEIIYGPASAVYGADAFAGIINITTDKDAAEKIAGNAEFNYGTYNSLDAFLETQLNVSQDLSFSLAGRFFKSDGPDFKDRDAAFGIIDNYQSPQTPEFQQPKTDYNFLFKARYKDFGLTFFSKQFDEGNAMPLNPSTYIYNKENRWKMNTNALWATYKKDFGVNGTLNLDFTLIDNVLDPESQFFKWKVANTPGETFSQYMTGQDKSAKGVAYYTNTLNEKLQFVGGFEYEYTQSIPPYANDEILGNSFKYEGDNATKIDDALTIDEQRYAGFAQFTIKPIEQIDIVAGGRYDYSSRYEGTFNPRAGLVLKFLPKNIIKFIYGTAFQAPSLFYQYEQFGTPTVVMLSTSEVSKLPQYPNWELKNQKVTSYEASLDQTIGENLNLKASFYINQLTDIIERVTFADATNPVYNKYFNKNTSGIRNENIGKQDIKGLIVSFNTLVAEQILITGSYGYTDGSSEINGKETDIPRIAKHKAWVSLTFSNLFNYVSVSPRLKWVGDVNNINTTIYPEGTQKGYTNLDIYITSTYLFDHLCIFAEFRNVLNQKYDHGGLFGQSGPYMAFVPQDLLRFRFGLSFKI